MERELSQSRGDAAQSASLCEALKAQGEELRREAKDIAREAAAKLAVRLERYVKGDWAGVIGVVIGRSVITARRCCCGEERCQ